MKESAITGGESVSSFLTALQHNIAITGFQTSPTFTYYMFNVDYPRQYAKFFATPQSLVLGQPYLNATLKKYAFLPNKLNCWQ